MSIFKKLFLSLSLIGHFWQEKINGTIFRWNLLFIILQLVIIFIRFSSLPPQIPLYYSLPWGESQLAPASHIFLLPAFSLGILLLNLALSVFFLRQIQLLSRLLIVFSLIFSILSAITVFKIINLIS